jgi:ribosomal protein S27E
MVADDGTSAVEWSDDDDGTGAVEWSDADAFALVGNEHRAAILRALLDAHADAETPYPTPFAVLRERAGVAVSSQFAYHLDALVGAFVAKTGDGYRLRYAGWKAAAALAAGTYASQPAFGPTRVDGTCPHCRASALHASYGDAWLTVACHGCERVLARYPFPPGPASGRLQDAGVAALLDAFDRRVRSHFALAADGVCPECAGRTATALEAVAHPEETTPTATRGDGHALEAVADCEQCGNHLAFPVGLLALDDPAVDAALADRGFDPGTTPFWELPVLDDDAVTPSGTDPLEATVAVGDDDPHEATVTVGDDALTVTVTADLDVRR